MYSCQCGAPLEQYPDSNGNPSHDYYGSKKDYKRVQRGHVPRHDVIAPDGTIFIAGHIGAQLGSLTNSAEIVLRELITLQDRIAALERNLAALEREPDPAPDNPRINMPIDLLNQVATVLADLLAEPMIRTIGESAVPCPYCGSFRNHNLDCETRVAARVLSDLQLWIDPRP